ncbi:hypothetical protein NQ117_14955 [Paenibacillus sp. SC116]|uniref:hypothetical protein n=1 Tax=Paenibacillus sp. SC116 TaxID=2968986 RepID=UPI00215AEAA0|nr:hypothetical protein [Paenibacillus sp. SC116]MCR8844979.1 hypothetical protein [Paenibacillus sp. SC116]
MKYSTGILRKAPRTNYALVDVVNLNTRNSRSVTVQVFDWSNGNAIPLKLSPYHLRTCRIRVGPNQSVYVYADVTKVKFKYEVRITQSDARDLISNVTGVTKVTFAPQAGDTVLQHNLVRITS